MKSESTAWKVAPGIAGATLLAAVLALVAVRSRRSDPALMQLAVLGGGAGVALIAAAVVISGRDGAARRRSETALREMAMVDDLTGLYNRRGFTAHSTDVLRLAQRMGRPAILFLADVDGLKAINDRYGHAAGDLTLAGAARALQLTFRSSDVIARLGGDEFGVLAIVDSREGGTGILQRLDRNVDFWNSRSGQPFAVSLSIGVVSIDPSTERLEHILARADRDLYEKKASRGNKFSRS